MISSLNSTRLLQTSQENTVQRKALLTNQLEKSVYDELDEIMNEMQNLTAEESARNAVSWQL